MTDEQKIMNAYASMTPWARGIVLELVQGYAIDFPEPGPGSAVVAVEPPTNDADESVDGLPLVVVGKPVDG